MNATQLLVLESFFATGALGELDRRRAEAVTFTWSPGSWLHINSAAALQEWQLF